MILGNGQNPIARLNNWSQVQKGQVAAPRGPRYQDAMLAFETDTAELQCRDRDGTSATSWSTDVDLRPGEVEIPHFGSLHSTEQGFSVRRLQEPGYVNGPPPEMFSGGPARVPSETAFRDYQVNTTTGTIDVINTCDMQEAYYGTMRFRLPATVEKYTIDTRNGTIADYSKIVQQ